MDIQVRERRIPRIKAGLGSFRSTPVLNRVLETGKDLGSSHILDLLHQSLQLCEDNLSNIQKQLYIGSGFKKDVRSLEWPFRQNGLRQFLEKTKAYVEIFQLALTREGM